MIEEKSVVQRILRPFLLFAVLVAAMTGLAACGGGDDGGGGGSGKGSSGDTDVATILDRAFAADQKITKGKLSLSLDVQAAGQGNVTAKVSGPFESQGDTKVPKVDFDVEFSGGGQNIKAGAEHTGTKAFVNYNGQEYVVDDATYKQFVQGYEQAAAQSKKQNGGKNQLSDLGINPKDWLSDPKNAGEGEVEGEEVVKVTGAVDLDKMLADINTLVQKAGSLGLSGGANVPQKLTDEQIKQVKDAVKKVDVEIDAAKSDSSLRRIKLTVNAVNPEKSSETIDATFDITLSDVGESQDFPEPSGAKPITELLGQFGGLGGLGGASAGGASSGSGSGSSASQKKLQEYTDCLEAAGSDAAKAQACAEKLK